MVALLTVNAKAWAQWLTGLELSRKLNRRRALSPSSHCGMASFCVKFGPTRHCPSQLLLSNPVLLSMPDKFSSAAPPASPDAPAPPAPPASIFQARRAPGGPCFDAPADLPLLQAAERAGLAVVSSCRNGTCRACICQLASGRVVYRIDWPGLSLDEKQAGCILPCVAYPVSDVVFA